MIRSLILICLIILGIYPIYIYQTIFSRNLDAEILDLQLPACYQISYLESLGFNDYFGCGASFSYAKNGKIKWKIGNKVFFDSMQVDIYSSAHLYPEFIFYSVSMSREVSNRFENFLKINPDTTTYDSSFYSYSGVIYKIKEYNSFDKNYKLSERSAAKADTLPIVTYDVRPKSYSYTSKPSFLKSMNITIASLIEQNLVSLKILLSIIFDERVEAE